MTPQPPSARATPVMFGQNYLTADGKTITAACDGVLLELLSPDGQVMTSYFDSIDGMMRLSTGIAEACGRATRSIIGEDGQRIPGIDRLRRLAGQ